ncbi:S-layer homology domain-containing protein [Paenibacillus sp. 1P07SE]|uniref:S-layer homology domain-containing protein n=1 Tax=Paenibacillus sp. 1P07SE TaxID=3132209 RepID=UPI0039A71A08
MALLLAIALLAASIAPAGAQTMQAQSEEQAPELIVTEIHPNNTGTDDYEFFELYNNSTKPLHLQEYSFLYRYTTTNSADVPLLVPAVTLAPQQLLVVWYKPKDNHTFADFNAKYGVNLSEEQLVVLEKNSFAGMANTGNRAIAIRNPAGAEIAVADYLPSDVTDGKGVDYGLPVSGTSQSKHAILADPTPGSAAADQLPAEPVELPDHINLQPRIEHTPLNQGAAGEPLLVTAVVTNPDAAIPGSPYADESLTAHLHYKLKSEETFDSLDMVRSGDRFEAAIPTDLFKGIVQVDYYIEASDSEHTVQTSVYTLTVMGEGGDPSMAPELLITELLPDSTNVDGADGYEYIEVYNNTDQEIDLQDYKIKYRYTSRGPAGDVIWPTDREDIRIPAGEAVVFWIINDKNTGVPVEAFNDLFGTSLIEGENLFKMYSAGMANGGERGVVIATNTNREIAVAYYDPGDAKPDMGIFYAAPYDGSKTMIKYSAGLIAGTPGSVDPIQVPATRVSLPEDTEPPVIGSIAAPTEHNLSRDLIVKADVSDNRQLNSVALFYKIDQDADYSKMYVQQDYNDLLYAGKISSADLIGKTSVQFYYEASDGQNRVQSDTHEVRLTGGLDRSPLRLNVQEGDILSGTHTIKATAQEAQPESVAIELGSDAAELYRALEHDAYFVFDAIDVNYYFKNAVTMGNEILYTFMDTINEYTTLTYPIEAWRLQQGENKIQIRAGSKAGPFDDRPEENKDDFQVKNVRLVLADGTTFYDPTYGSRELRMGDSAGKLEDAEFVFHLPLDQLKAQATDWDTRAVPDGEHIVTAKTGEETVSVEILVDNTPPSIAAMVEDGRMYRGAIRLDAVVSDALSGVDTVEAELDGNSISLPYATSSGQLVPGEHQLIIRATDKVGNLQEQIIVFSVPDENPLQPQLVGPSHGQSGVSLNPELRVKASDPTDDLLTVSFFRGFKYDANRAAGFKAVQGASATEPPPVMTPAGETPLTAAELDLIGAKDGEYLIHDATEKFPYHRFEIALDGSVKPTDRVDIVWSGKSLDGRKVSLYAWSPGAGKWALLDEHVAVLEEDFELTANVAAGDYDVDRTIQVMVQDEVTASEKYDFTFVWMSDTQYYSESYPEIYDRNVEWIAKQKDAMNIHYVIHTGDVVDKAHQEFQWVNADRSMKVLEENNIPYGVLAGNHDVLLNSENPYQEYYKWFGEDRFNDQPHYGGSYQNNRGHYDLISAGGVDFIIVYMGWLIGDEEIQWMHDIVAAHPDRKAIISLHEYLLVSNNRAPIADEIYERVVVPNKNVFAVLCGHYHDAQTLIDEIDDDGDGVPDRKVYQMLADYQGAPRGGLGYLRLMHFNLEGDTIHMKTYSPYLDEYNYYKPGPHPGKDEFDIPLDLSPMVKRVATDYFAARVYTDQRIGTQSQVVSGGEAAVTWSNLAPAAGFEWYAVAEDEYSGRTLSEIWRFTTRGGGGQVPQYPNPPVIPQEPKEDQEEPGSPETPETGAEAIRPERTGDGYAVTGEQLKSTLELSGPVRIAIEAEPAELVQLELDGDGLEAVRQADKELQISAGPLMLTLPAAALREAGTMDRVTLRVKAGAPSAEESQRLSQLAENDNAYRTGGLIFTLELTGVRGDTETLIKQFDAPVTVSYAWTAAERTEIDTDYAGIYYLGDQGASYMGGRFSSDTVRFNTDHFSSFALLEYRKSFSDMTGHWAEAYVGKLAARHVANGVSDQLYAPGRSVTRADFAVLAVRLLGEAPGAAGSAFEDVQTAKYYAGYVAKAAELGLIEGYRGNFRPEETISREEAVAVLMKLYRLQGGTPGAPGQAPDFADLDEAGAWAVPAIREAQALQLISGRGDNRLAPKAEVTRAEAAKMMAVLLP